MKTGVQSIAKVLKTLDSGFRRNDVKKNEINFFTPSGRVRVGGKSSPTKNSNDAIQKIIFGYKGLRNSQIL